jgi:hypothetical protein
MHVGIWLDFKEAWLVVFDKNNTTPEIKHIQSNIEWGVPKGGSRGNAPWGPQMAINEQAFLARRKKEEKDYFESILAALDPEANELFIFGPAEAKIGLQKAIKEIKHFPAAVKDVQPADSMTQNQIVAKVRDFFNVDN